MSALFYAVFCEFFTWSVNSVVGLDLAYIMLITSALVLERDDYTRTRTLWQGIFINTFKNN